MSTPVLPGETPQEWSARVLAAQGSKVAARRVEKIVVRRRKREAVVVPVPVLMPVHSAAAVRCAAKFNDETFRRVRAACSEFSVVDLDDHAARITLDVLNARATPRYPR